MKHFSVVGFNRVISVGLYKSGLNYSITDGKYKGTKERCIVIEHLGALDAESVRKDINRLAFLSGEESVVHYNFGVASLEFANGSWLISKDQRSMPYEPSHADYVKLGDDYVTFNFTQVTK